MTVLLSSSLTLALAPASVVAVPVALVASAPDDEYVRDVASEVATHVEAGRYEDALGVLDAAERERPHVVFIYVRATIEERRGNCERAATLYREFLDRDVPAADARDARQGETRCREALGLPPPDAEAPPSADAPEQPPDGGEDDLGEPHPPAWYADPWGGVLLVGGVAGLGVGVGLYVQSRADERAANGATSLQSFEDRSRRAVMLNRAGIVTMTLGSALFAAGIVRYALVATRKRRGVTLVPTWVPRGGALVARVRF